MKSKKETVLSTYLGLPKEMYFLFLARMVNSMGRFIGPLLTLILTSKIGVDSAVAGSLITLSMILQAPCVLIGGKLTDAIGRKKVICTFFILSAIVFAICSCLPVSIYLAYMIMLGSCLSSFPTAAYDALVADLTNKNNRQTAYSMIYMGLNVGAAIASVIGGLLFENHLKILFLLDSITTVMASIIIYVFIKENREVKVKKLEKDKKIKEESVWKILKATPVLIVFSVIMALYSFVYQQYSFGMPLCMDAVFGAQSAQNYGIVSGINCVLVIFLTPIIVLVTKNIRINLTLTIAGFLYAGCFFIIPFSKSMLGFIIAIIALTLGEILCSINISTYVANMSKVSHLGRISAVISMIRESGSCVSSVVVGAVINSCGLYSAMMLVTVIAVIGAIGLIFLKCE